MSNSSATDAEWQGNYQIDGENRRLGSGRHRNHQRSPMPPQQQHQQQQQPQQHSSRYVQQQQQMPQHHQQQQQQGRKYHPQQQQPHQQQHQAVPGHRPQPGGAAGAVGAGASAYGITGQMRSGHIEVDSLYGSGSSGQLSVNSMNAPNNSTMQCGCENIDCPFCNLMTSVQMST